MISPSHNKVHTVLSRRQLSAVKRLLIEDACLVVTLQRLFHSLLIGT